MKDVIRKSLLFGIGVLDITRENAEKVVNAMVKRGTLSTKEGREVVRDVLMESKKTQKKIQALVEKKVKQLLKTAKKVKKKKK